MANPLKTDLFTIFASTKLEGIQKDIDKARSQLRNAEEMKGNAISRDYQIKLAKEKLFLLEDHQKTLLKFLKL